MPYRTEWENPEEFLEHNGVSVYHTYEDEDVSNEVRVLVFTLVDHSDDHAFDIRGLDVPSQARLKTLPELYSWPDLQDVIQDILREAIDRGLLKYPEQGETK